jgi:dipeptidyl aminopeptidase/acylaminoacyl peptidase
LIDLKANAAHRNPIFLPDGEHFLFVFRDFESGPAAGALYAASLQGGKPELVLPEASNVQFSRGYLLYYKGGNLLAQKFDSRSLRVQGDPKVVAVAIDYWNLRDIAYFAVSPDGVLAYRSANPPIAQLVWMNREGKELEKIGEPGYYNGAFLSADGNHVAVARLDPTTLRGDTWTIDVKRGTLSRATFNEQPQIAGGRDFALSPDGSQLAGASGLDPHFQVYLQPSSGSGKPVVLADGPNPFFVQDWSRDGRYLIVEEQDPKTNYDLYYIDLQGDRKMHPILQSPKAEIDGSISPDGKWLAYASDETGRMETYVTGFPSGTGKWQISTTGTANAGAVWSGDGRELYFMGREGVMVVPVQPRKGDSFEFGTPHLLLATPNGLIDFAPGPTSDRFLILHDAGISKPKPLQIVTNWTELLDK